MSTIIFRINFDSIFIKITIKISQIFNILNILFDKHTKLCMKENKKIMKNIKKIDNCDIVQPDEYFYIFEKEKKNKIKNRR